MKKLLIILFLFPYLAGCQKVYINHGSGTQVNINGTGTQATITGVHSETYPIEYKAESGDYASEIIIQAGGDSVKYYYNNKDRILIGEGTLSIDTDQPFSDIKDDVFTALSITELQDIVFVSSPENTNYVSFGNLMHLGGMNYAWGGRRGTTHLFNGHLGTLPYSSLNRTFGTRVIVNPLDAGQDLRGGSHCVIGTQIYFFSALYISATDEFVKMLLYKSTDLTGTSWNAADTLLHLPGTNGGVNEAFYARFNFYGTPVNIPGTQTWFVPWYEANTTAPPWRTNFIYTDDNFATWTTHNIVQGTNTLGEHCMEYLGDSTLISIARKNSNSPLYSSYSTDLGQTWSGYELTNLGAGAGRTMCAVKLTQDHGVVAVYGDRGTTHIMMSKDNDVHDILANSSGWNTPVIIYTESVEPTFHPLGYPSILETAQKRIMIAFSIEYTGSNARLFIGDGSIDNF